MIEYEIIGKEIRFIVNGGIKITIDEFIITVNDIFEKRCLDERIIDNDYMAVSCYFDIEDLMELLDYNPGLYSSSDDYILFTSIDCLNSYNICDLINELLDLYDDVVLEALGYDF